MKTTKRILLLSMLTLTVFTGFSQVFTPIWESCFGGTQWDQGESLIYAGGSYWSVGRTGSNDGDISYYHGGDRDVWLLNIDTNGNLISEKTFGGSKSDGGPTKILKLNDTVFYIVTGTSSSDGDITNNPWPGAKDNYWILKINNKGEILWNTICGGRSWQMFTDAAITNDNGIIVIGQSQLMGDDTIDGDITDHHGWWDFWITKLDSSGQKQWALSLGGIAGDFASTIIQTSDGGYIAGGSTDGFGGGNFDTACNYHDYNGSWGFKDTWLIKLDSAGNIEWQQCYGGTYDEIADCIMELPDGYIVVGATNSNDGDVSGFHGAPGGGQPYDIWVFKIDKIGNLLWQKCLGGTYWEWARNIFPTTDGVYMIVGSTESNDGDVSGNNNYGTGYPIHDVWFAKIDSAGNLLWQYCYGGRDDEMLYRGVIQKGDWDYVLAIGTTTFDWRCHAEGNPWPDLHIAELYDSTVGINETTADAINVKLYPNPAGSQLTVELKNYKTLHNATLELISINGKLVLTKTLTASKTQLKTSNLSNGIYLLKIEMDKGILTRKIIVEH